MGIGPKGEAWRDGRRGGVVTYFLSGSKSRYGNYTTRTRRYVSTQVTPVYQHPGSMTMSIAPTTSLVHHQLLHLSPRACSTSRNITRTLSCWHIATFHSSIQTLETHVRVVQNVQSKPFERSTRAGQPDQDDRNENFERT